VKTRWSNLRQARQIFQVKQRIKNSSPRQLHTRHQLSFGAGTLDQWPTYLVAVSPKPKKLKKLLKNGCYANYYNLSFRCHSLEQRIEQLSECLNKSTALQRLNSRTVGHTFLSYFMTLSISQTIQLYMNWKGCARKRV
jgi:hypothetical protein